MNITQILLSSTAVMLLVAIILSYGDMRSGVAEEGRKQSASQLIEENARLQAELDRLRSGMVAPAAQIEIPPTMSEERLTEIEKQNDLLKQQLVAEEDKRKQAEAEAMALTERQSGKINKEERRARMIAMAMVMAQVSEVAEQDGISVIVLDVKMPDQVQMNTQLAIRRGNGIIGRVEVSNIVDGNVFADPLPGTFPGGSIDVKVGDELIISLE
ncbi:MAG: hypothetical protein ACSHX0_00395 [Akkermansiaceae bacterium]